MVVSKLLDQIYPTFIISLSDLKN